MHSKDRLSKALSEAGLSAMAAKASEGYYHDYLSRLAAPALALIEDLSAACTEGAEALIIRVMAGEFDATYDEEREWAMSEKGKAAFRRIAHHG